MIIFNNKIKYILLYTSMDIGGIESLVVNLCSKLGVEALLICPKGKLDNNINPSCLRIFDLDNCDFLKIKPIKGNDYFLISFDPLSSYYALKIYKNNKFLNLYSGVFHPKSYFYDNKINLINKFLLKCLSTYKIFFMNKEVFESHNKFIKLNLRNSYIFPLPFIKNGNFINLTDKNNEIKIISIGRYDEFKKYNFGTFEIVKELLRRNIIVKWDLYGHGNTKQDLINLSIEQNLFNYINFYDSIEYNDLHKLLNKYDIFVGMGKTALEVGSSGIPVICAIPYENNLTHGYLFELPVGNLGEKIINYPSYTIDHILLNYINSTLSEKRLIIYKMKNYINNSYPTVSEYIENFKPYSYNYNFINLSYINITIFLYNLCFLNPNIVFVKQLIIKYINKIK